MTQKTLSGADERVSTTIDIIRDTSKSLPEDMPENKRNKMVLWLSMLQFPDVVCLFEMAGECKKYSPNERAWLDMLKSIVADYVQTRDLPSQETLARGLREIKEGKQKMEQVYKYGKLAKTI